MGLLYLLLFLVVRVDGLELNSPFILPSETTHNVEFYDKGDTRYAIYLDKVSGTEAKKLCGGKNKGHLLEFLDEELQLFIARALAESAVSFGTLWIGGEFTPSTTEGGEGQWKWSTSGDPIIAKLPADQKFPMNSTPYWVDRPTITAKEKHCLGMDRRLHQLPLIVDLPCSMERPFVCRMAAATTGEGPIMVKPPAEVGGSEFFVFHALYTWEEAMAFCLSIGMKLAKLTTQPQFTVVSNRMRRARPIVENAWIGGQYDNEHWTWIGFNEMIVVNQSSLTEGQLFPWYRPDNIIMDGCLLADRHVCDHFVYVEAKCDRRRSFICQTDSPDLNETALIKVNDKSVYWVSTYPETWVRAQNACATCLGGELLQLKATKEDMETQLPMLFTAMALTLREEIRHIWLGGYLFKDVWKWTKHMSEDPPEPEKIIDPMAYEALFPEVDGERVNDGKGTLSFEPVDYKTESYLLAFKCLDLDRENQKYFFMYGLQCDVKQHFICQAKSVDTNLSDHCDHKHLANVNNNAPRPVT